MLHYSPWFLRPRTQQRRGFLCVPSDLVSTQNRDKLGHTEVRHPLPKLVFTWEKSLRLPPLPEIAIRAHGRIWFKYAQLLEHFTEYWWHCLCGDGETGRQTQVSLPCIRAFYFFLSSSNQTRMNQEERGLGPQNLDRGKDAVCNEKAVWKPHLERAPETDISLCLLRWHWLIGSYRFQVWISVLQVLYIALCAHQDKCFLRKCG